MFVSGTKRRILKLVHGCAGATPAFKQKELAVVGGGDTAVEEALYLTKYGKHVSGLLMPGNSLFFRGTADEKYRAASFHWLC